MAVLVPDEKHPHNHPMPAITKLTLEDKLLYKTVVNAHGTLGATVNKIDHGMSFM